MKKLTVAIGLLGLLAAGPVLAQGGGAGGGSGGTGASSTGSKGAFAPHRQPRAADFANEKSLGASSDASAKEDAALDKKIKSICRGC